MKMESSPLVIVKVPLNIARHIEKELVAARFLELGLTAYGRTESEAVLSLKRLFNKFIHTYREWGTLEERLECLGVEWYWGYEYPSDGPPYEDTNDLFETWTNLKGVNYTQALPMAA